ncbi:hypothetical protein [Lacunimicrobium album]|jgi:hypothetical protein
MFRYLKFTLACAIIAAIWLGALPWLADRPAMRSHIDSMQQQGIDPSAMYYTEVYER